MTYFLQSFAGDGSSIDFHKGKVLRIGRGTQASLRLDGPMVELEHAEIRRDDHGYVLGDLSRGAGIRVNDQPVRTYRLVDGDRIEIGGFLIQARLRRPGNPLSLRILRLAETDDDTTMVTTLSPELLAQMEQESAGEAGDLVPGGPLEDSSTFDPEATVAMVIPDELRDPDGPPAGLQATVAMAIPDELRGPGVSGPGASSASRGPAGEGPAGGSRPAPRIDYAGAYRLGHGVLHQGLLVLLLGLAGTGSLWALVRQGHWQIFSPGSLADPHQAVIENNCQKCHGGWQRVADPACVECHDDAGAHQTAQAEAPACTDCHTEHRGGDALRMRDPRICTDCHAGLDTQVIGQTSFAARITRFAPDDHPEFAVYTESDRGRERRRLDASLGQDGATGAPVDAGGIQGFSHAWHLRRLPASMRPDCEDCHLLNGEGEIAPLHFEDSCQRCHSLSFDPRFPGEQAPHAEPREVLIDLSGRYALRPDVLGRLRGPDRRRLQGKRLTPERQLSELARLHTERLVRNQCVKCHHTESEEHARQPIGGIPVESLTVRPANLRARWLPHATFRHQPHLELISCRECHEGAAASKDPGDVLLPGIAICFDCHRPPRPGEQELHKLGGTRCLECHGYHPESAERLAREAGLDEEST